MSNLSGFVKRLRDIMRNDAGINGSFPKTAAGRTGRMTINPATP